ncbi:MAG: fibronectin type III domain-containing protein [Bacteroidia bacterium]|nr:fibronectin type III domain-containing protein [Bacteroidia bacterium]
MESSNPPFLLPTPIITTTTTFYLESSIGECISNRSAVVVFFTPIPGIPSAANLRFCGQGVAIFTALMGTPAGSSIRLFTTIGATAPIAQAQTAPYTLSVGLINQTQTYYIASFLEECSSPRVAVVATVDPEPVLPRADNVVLCRPQRAVFTLNSSGSSSEKVYLFASQVGGNAIDSANHLVGLRLTTPVLSQNTTFYLQSSTAPNCNSNQIPVEVTVLPTFNIAAENEGRICANPTASFTLSATSYPTAIYLWRGPNGFSATGATVQLSNVNSASSGIYQVSISALGCNYELSLPVTILQVPSIQARSNSPLCPGSTLILEARSDIMPVTWQWNGPNNFVATNANVSILNVKVEQSGVYSVVASNGFCSSLPATVIVDIGTQNLPIQVGPAQSVCQGSTVVLTATSLPGVTFEWKGPNHFRSLEQNPVLSNIMLNQSGLYSVTAFLGSCTSQTATVLVEVQPLPVVSITCRSRFVCAGDSIFLRASTIPGARYQWQGPANFNSTEQNPIIPNAQTIHRGRYVVQAFVGNCASRPESLVIFVLDLAPPQLESLTVVRCGPGNITFTVTSTEPQTDILFYDENFNLLDRKSQAPAFFTTYLGAPSARYYFSCISPEDCESERIPVLASFIQTPGTPFATEVSRCGIGPVTFTAQMGIPAGQMLRLFSQPSGGNPIAVAITSPYLLNVPEITTSTVFYLESTAVNECGSSQRQAIFAKLNTPAPIPVASGNLSRCGEGYITFTVLASGASSIQLFTTESAVEPAAVAVSSPFVFTSPWLTTTTTLYLVSQTSEGCQSPKTPFTLSLVSAEVPIVVANVRRCQAGAVTFTVQSTGAREFRLYTDPVGGTLITRTQTSPYVLTVPFVSQTTTFYVEQVTGDNCISSRTPVVAEIIQSVPSMPNAFNTERCGIGSILISVNTGPVSGTEIRVYDAANNRIATLMPPYQFITPILTQTTTFYLESYDAQTGCTSARSVVVARIHPMPTIVEMPPVWRCGGGRVTFTFTTNTPEATTLYLYSQPTGGVPIQIIPLPSGITTFTFTTEPMNNSFTYYASISSLTCGEGSRTAAEAHIGSLLQLQVQVTHGTPGRIVAQVGGGFPPYSYRIANRIQSSPIFDDLLPGTYLLRVNDSRNCIAEQQVTIYPLECRVPQSPQVQRDASGRLFISWSAVEGATGYELQYRLQGSDNWGPIITLTEPKYFFRDLLPEMMYEVRIRTLCGNLFSEYVPLNFPTPICNAVNFIWFTDVTENSAVVNWSLMEGATAYEFTWRKQGTQEWQPTELLTGDRRLLSGLERGTTYDVRVRTICFGGSVIADYVYQTFTTIKCDPVINLRAEEITSGSAVLRWERVIDAVNYQVQYQKSGSNTWQTVTTTNTYILLDNLEAGSTYVARVQTMCRENIQSSGAAQVVFTTTTLTTTCNPPTDIRVNSITSESVTLSWVPVAGATGYMLRYKRINEPNWTSVNANTPFWLTGLMPGQTYEFMLRSICGATPSDFSSRQVFTTLNPKNFDSFIHSFEIYPNPTSGLLQVYFVSEVEETLYLELVDLLGNRIHSYVLKALAGKNLQTLHLPEHLANGIYFLLFQRLDEAKELQRFKIQLVR